MLDPGLAPLHRWLSATGYSFTGMSVGLATRGYGETLLATVRHLEDHGSVVHTVSDHLGHTAKDHSWAPTATRPRTDGRDIIRIKQQGLANNGPILMFSPDHSIHHRASPSLPLQDSTGQPPLPAHRVLEPPVPAPLPLDAVTVPLPDPLDLQPDLPQGLLLEEAPHLLPAGVEPRHDPGPRRPVVPQEPLDRPLQILVLPRHPEAVTHKHPVERVMVLRGKRRREVPPRVTVCLHDPSQAAAAGGRELGPRVPRDVVLEVGDDSRGGVVRDEHAAGAEQRREQGGEGGAGAQLGGGQAGDVEAGEGRAAVLALAPSASSLLLLLPLLLLRTPQA